MFEMYKKSGVLLGTPRFFKGNYIHQSGGKHTCQNWADYIASIFRLLNVPGFHSGRIFHTTD